MYAGTRVKKRTGNNNKTGKYYMHIRNVSVQSVLVYSYCVIPFLFDLYNMHINAVFKKNFKTKIRLIESNNNDNIMIMVNEIIKNILHKKCAVAVNCYFSM